MTVSVHVWQCMLGTLQSGHGSPTSTQLDSPSKPETGVATISIYGRLTERAQLARAGAVQPVQVALITGPPGIGKTALLKEFCEARQHQGVCYIDCQDVNTGTPAGG
jgi:Cdc6-like AAA superfamily ATPase